MKYAGYGTVTVVWETVWNGDTTCGSQLHRCKLNQRFQERKKRNHLYSRFQQLFFYVPWNQNTFRRTLLQIWQYIHTYKLVHGAFFSPVRRLCTISKCTIRTAMCKFILWKVWSEILSTVSPSKPPNPPVGRNCFPPTGLKHWSRALFCFLSVCCFF